VGQTTCQILSESNKLEACFRGSANEERGQPGLQFVGTGSVGDLIPPTTAGAPAPEPRAEAGKSMLLCADDPGERPRICGHKVRIRGVIFPPLDALCKIVSMRWWTPGWNQMMTSAPCPPDPRLCHPRTTSKKLNWPRPVRCHVRARSAAPAGEIGDHLG